MNMVNSRGDFVNYEFHLTYASAGRTRPRTRARSIYRLAQINPLDVLLLLIC